VALLGAARDLGGGAAGSLLARALAESAPSSEPESRPCDAPSDVLDVAFGPTASFQLASAAAPEAPSDVLPSTTGVPVSVRDTAPWPAIAPMCSVPHAAPPELQEERAAVLLAAIDAAGSADRLEPVDALLGLLARPDPQLRARAAGALARVTNRSFGEGW